jgi:16S rRNA (cytosine967-C5)-methyltransferase
VLRAYFREHAAMGQHDRALVAEGTFAFLRRMRSLEALAQTTAPRKLALAVLARDLGHSVRELEGATRAAEREWLAGFKGRLATTLPPAVAADLPDWLWERLGATYGEARRDALAKAFAVPAPFDLRANVLKTSRDEALAALAAEGLRVAPTPYAPFGLRVAGRPMLARHPWLADGRLEVQDEGSQLVAHLVAPKRTDLVVDFCAGAGGKALALGALMRSTGRVYAFDVSERRLAELKPRLARSGLSNLHPQRIASERDPRVKRLAGKIDRVLVDAPCSGTGTLRRNPDIKWRRIDLAALAASQKAILAAAATLVKPGGRLVYATCSLLREENEDVVNAFLATHPEFKPLSASDILARRQIALPLPPAPAGGTGEVGESPLYGLALRLLPHRHQTDAFFALALERGK